VAKPLVVDPKRFLYDKKVTLVTDIVCWSALQLLQVICNKDATFLQQAGFWIIAWIRLLISPHSACTPMVAG
jgi:hypothetical protein